MLSVKAVKAFVRCHQLFYVLLLDVFMDWCQNCSPLFSNGSYVPGEVQRFYGGMRA